NNLKELWALLNFLFPEIFSDSDEFEEIFDLTNNANTMDLSPDDREKRNMHIVSRLHKLLKPFLLRRIKKEVMKELPPKREYWLFVSLTELQTKLYKHILSRSITALQGGEGSSRTQLLNVAMQLRKASNHPYLFDGYEDKTADPFGMHVIENAGKLRLMDKLLQRLMARGSRTLIFSQMTRMIDILEDYCRIRQISYFRIDGNTSGEERDRQIEEFNAPNSPVIAFLLSTRAGGLGINLASADTVILYDSDWNPQVDLQAMDRAHRIGQKYPVNVYRLIQEGTIEELIVEKALLKLQLDSAVIQHGRLTDKQKQLTKSELMMMVQFGADHIFKSGKSDITEEDLDALLARGEEKSNIINSKLREHVKKSVLDFSINSNTNLYEYDGIDYNQEQRKADRTAWAAIAVTSLENRDEREARRRVRLMKEQEMQALNRGNRGLPRVNRLPAMHEWQFYNKARILKLHEAEMEHYRSGGVSDKFTEKHQEEKQRLLREGFADWSRRDFLSFIRRENYENNFTMKIHPSLKQDFLYLCSGSEMFGRDDGEGISTEVDGKCVEEVKHYNEVFWKRFKDLSDWEKWLKKIEAGELLIRKKKAMEEIICKKQQQYKFPWRELRMNLVGHKGKTVFVEEEDRWLLNMTALLGHGQWEKLKVFVSQDPQWRFDWMMRSRTSYELGRRVDALIRLLRKGEAEKPMRGKRSKDILDLPTANELPTTTVSNSGIHTEMDTSELNEEVISLSNAQSTTHAGSVIADTENQEYSKAKKLKK
ncbi:SWI2/SNF2 ISWI-like SANT, partial [Cardiosporidium cionae]